MSYDTTTPAAKSRPRWLKPVLYTLAGLLIFSLGTAAGGNEATAKPAPAVTITAEPEVKEVTKEVVTVPQACLDALDDAQDFIGVATDFTLLMSDHMQDDVTIFNALAAGDYTMGGIDPTDYDISGDVQALTAKVTGNDFDKHSTACKEAS